MRAAILLLLAGAAFAADGTRIRVETVKPEVIEQRLAAVKLDVQERRETLEALFRDAGCEALTSQPVLRSKPNLICTLPGENETGRTIVVGAHFDFASLGQGVVDNWSGASLLPSLYQSLAGAPRRHRFVFVEFAAEETGLNGSKEFVRKLSREERAAVAAMVNFDSLGLGPATIWASRADKRLASFYFDIASYLGQKPAGANIDKVGDDDSHPFKDAKIPVISFHSVTTQTLPILHSVRDNPKAIDAKHYYDAYRLASMYLAYLDAVLD